MSVVGPNAERAFNGNCGDPPPSLHNATAVTRRYGAWMPWPWCLPQDSPSRVRESRAEQHLTVEVEAAHAMVGLLGEIKEAALRIDGETEEAVA